ncbi:MAG: peptidoglycan editing factor PgeF [Steroidobacteraceae bacterium]
MSLRGGGCSRAPYASFNLALHVGDNPRDVIENRRRLRTQLALPSEPLWLSQVHGTHVVDADSSVCPPLPQADGAVTRRPGRVLAVLVADCLPVLFARQDGSAVAIAHAGWRGLAAGVLEATVAALGGAGETLQAWLGPAIGPDHFEVGEEVRHALGLQDTQADSAFRRNPRGRWQCDLHALTRRRLAGLGVRSVHGERRCSYAQQRSFYSYRRDGVTGRMAALIWLNRAQARTPRP